MAQTWRTIADSEVDPESPVTTSLAQAWRDNPEGIAAGVAGAPRIQRPAMDTDSVDQGAIVANSVGQSEAKTTSTTESGEFSVSIRNLASGSWGFGFRSRHDNNYSTTDVEMGSLIGRADSTSGWTETTSPPSDTGLAPFASMSNQSSSQIEFYIFPVLPTL